MGNGENSVHEPERSLIMPVCITAITGLLLAIVVGTIGYAVGKSSIQTDHKSLQAKLDAATKEIAELKQAKPIGFINIDNSSPKTLRAAPWSLDLIERKWPDRDGWYWNEIMHPSKVIDKEGFCRRMNNRNKDLFLETIGMKRKVRRFAVHFYMRKYSQSELILVLEMLFRFAGTGEKEKSQIRVWMFKAYDAADDFDGTKKVFGETTYNVIKTRDSVTGGYDVYFSADSVP